VNSTCTGIFISIRSYSFDFRSRIHFEDNATKLPNVIIRLHSPAVHDLRGFQVLAVNSSHNFLQEATLFKFASFCNEAPLRFNNGLSCAAKAGSPSSTCTAMTKCKPSKVSRWPGREMREKRLTNGTRTSARGDAYPLTGFNRMADYVCPFLSFFASLEYILIPEYAPP